MGNPAPASSTWVARALQTSPVMDGHSHAFPDSLAARAIDSLSKACQPPIKPWTDGTVAGLTRSMDQAGIRRALLCSVATRPQQVPAITDWSARIQSERIIAVASMHPDFDRVEEEVARAAGLGIKGFKFHSHYMNCPVDDPRVIRIARALARHGLFLTIHSGHDIAYPDDDRASPARIANLHQAVGDLRLLACHLGGFRYWEDVLRLLAGQDIYLESSFCLAWCPLDLIQRIINAHSPQRLMFGTDSPWASQEWELAAWERLDLSPAALRLAWWDNGHRLAGIKAAS